MLGRRLLRRCPSNCDWAPAIHALPDSFVDHELSSADPAVAPQVESAFVVDDVIVVVNYKKPERERVRARSATTRVACVLFCVENHSGKRAQRGRTGALAVGVCNRKRPYLKTLEGSSAGSGNV